jgi:hypothetical protein
MSEESQIAFFWRDVQTLQGAIRAALSRPNLDLGELRAIEVNEAFTVQSGVAELPVAGKESLRRLSLHSRQFRDLATAQAIANPLSLRDLFACAMQRQLRVVA